MILKRKRPNSPIKAIQYGGVRSESRFAPVSNRGGEKQ